MFSRTSTSTSRPGSPTEGPGGGGHHGVDTRRSHARSAAARDSRCGREAVGPRRRASRLARRSRHHLQLVRGSRRGRRRVGLDEVFEERILPVLTPLAVDPGHPLPYISHLSLNLAVVVRYPVATTRSGEGAPAAASGSWDVADGERFVRSNGSSPPTSISSSGHGGDRQLHFPVTRNAGPHVGGRGKTEAMICSPRSSSSCAGVASADCSLDWNQASAEVRELLQRELDLEDDDVYPNFGPLDLGGLWSVHELDRPTSRIRLSPRVMPQELRRVRKGPPMSSKRSGRRLPRAPSLREFAATVEEFVREAAADPQVLAISLRRCTAHRVTAPSSARS